MESSLKMAFLALALAASPASAAPPASAPAPGITLKNELSAGVRLYGIDEDRVSMLGGNRIKLPAGSHTLNLRHAYDFEKSSSGPWVVQYDFMCEFPHPGNYTLHSKDGSIASTAPTIWIEAEGENAPACKRVGA